MLKLFPKYNIIDPWDLDEIVDVVNDGHLDAFILSLENKKSEFPLGTLSCAITHPVNNKHISIQIDLNLEVNQLVSMRVCDDGDGFINIKHDLQSLEMVIHDIKHDTIPLHNVNTISEILIYPAYDTIE